MPRTTPKAPPKAPKGQQSRTKGTATDARQKSTTARGRPPSAAAKGKGNKFDQIAEATAKGDDQLAAQLSASLSQSKTKAKPTADAKTDAKPKGPPKSAFAGRPVSDPAKVAARIKELKLRPRASVDVDALAVQLRATPDAVAAWLASRNGAAPAKSTDKAKAPAKPAPKADTPKVQATKPPFIALKQPWEGAVPSDMPELKGATLTLRYELLPDGTVTVTLWSIHDADGNHMTDAWKLPLDFRPIPERDDRNRIVKLKGDPTKAALQQWLQQQGFVKA